MKFLLPLCLLFFPVFLLSQDEIVLKNPSFEDIPKLDYTPRGWLNCGFFPSVSDVDVHPVRNSAVYVERPAIHGRTYLGMTTRETETWEALGQKLVRKLVPGKFYAFSISLARSEYYVSSGKSKISTGKMVNYNRPVKLRIWGGKRDCAKKELLAESPLIEHTDWKQYNFDFHPETAVNYLTLEVFYETPIDTYCNGNLLLDNASSIKEIDNIGYFFKEDEYALYGAIKGRKFKQPSEPAKHKTIETIEQESYTPTAAISAYLAAEEEKAQSDYAATAVETSFSPSETIEEDTPSLPVTLLTGEEIETCESYAGLVDFQRGMDELTTEASTALQGLAALVKKKETLKLSIFQKEQISFMQSTREKSLFRAIVDAGLSEDRFFLQSKPEDFIHYMVETKYLYIWLHE